MQGYPLVLSVKPLFALRIAFRECDVFFLGTASRKGERMSCRFSRVGSLSWNGREAKSPSAVAVAAMNGKFRIHGIESRGRREFSATDIAQ